MLPLCSELAAGIVTATGEPAAGCFASFYTVNTLIAKVVYADDGVTPIVPPLTLDAAGRGDVRSSEPFRLRVLDATGAVVFDHSVNIQHAKAVRVVNTKWNGGVEQSLDALLTTLGTNIGKDGKISASVASLGLALQTWANGVHIDVTGENAGGGNPVKGDDLTDCTAGIQAALTLAAANGGGVVYIPPGIYRFSAPLSIAGSGITVAGAGVGVTILKNTAAAGTGLSVSGGVTGVTIRDLTVTHATASTSAAISFASSSNCTAERVATEGHFYGIYAQDCSGLIVIGGKLQTAATAGARPLYYLGTGASAKHCIAIGVQASARAGESCCEVAGTQSDVSLFGCSLIGGAICFEIDAAATGKRFRIYGGELAYTLAVVDNDTGTDCQFFCDKLNTWVDVDVAGGAAYIPLYEQANLFRIEATGGTAMLAAAEPSIAAGETPANPHLYIVLYNHDGGSGTTTWTVDALYHLSAAISTTYGSRTALAFLWDQTEACWREVSRAVTT